MIFKPTKEQEAIVERAKLGTPFKISAFAGAAKTSTLVMVADELMHDSLYLAYNKRMALEAKEKFPDWVEVRTTHSLAYGVTGVEIAHKLVRPDGKYVNVASTASEIGRYFRMPSIQIDAKHKISQVALGKAVRDTVNNFEYSSDQRLTENHIVFGTLKKWILLRKIGRRTLVDKILPAAQELWRLRSNPRSNIMATHETYLKMFQLLKPDLSNYGTIYLDEAQDSNACILDIVSRQKSQVILVGDNFQSIYQWRGSTNALEKVHTDAMELSASFRFGQPVADVANTILNVSEKVDIRGFDKIDSAVVVDETDVPYPYTKIYRTNAGLIEDAVELLADGRSVYVEIDFKDLIKAIHSAVALKAGDMKAVKHDLFVACTDWEDAKLEATFSNEMARIVGMVQEDRHIRVLDVLEHYSHPHNPEITMITAHKSKGLEWDNVVIANDFPPVFNEEGKYAWDEQERNLSYVAHTRAKKHLCVGMCMKQIAEQTGSAIIPITVKQYVPMPVDLEQEVKRQQIAMFGISRQDDLVSWIIDGEDGGDQDGRSWRDVRPY